MESGVRNILLHGLELDLLEKVITFGRLLVSDFDIVPRSEKLTQKGEAIKQWK